MSEADRNGAWKITITNFVDGVDIPPRSGKKQNRLDDSTVVNILDDLSEVVDSLMDRTPEYNSHLVRPRNTVKAKYLQTGNLLAASVLQALTAETGLKFLYEMENPKKLATSRHHLLEIFETLSENTQNRLNRVYIQLIKSSRHVRASGADLSAPELQHVKEVFRVHAQMFVLWRYFAEGRSGPGFSEHLCRAIDAMRVVIEESMDSSADGAASVRRQTKGDQ